MSTKQSPVASIDGHAARLQPPENKKAINDTIINVFF
jgi:hypothetical protein